MDNLASIPVTENCLNAGIAFGTTTTTNVATAATGAVIGGKFTATLSSSATTATPTTDAVTGATFVTIPVNYCAALVFGVNAAGSLVAAQGPLMPTLAGLTTTAGGFIQAPQFPALPDNFCPLAYTIIRAAPTLSAGFIVGSTQWAASGATCLTPPVNVSTLPPRPQVS